MRSFIGTFEEMMPEQLPNGDGIFPMPGPPPPPVRSEVNWKQAVAPPLVFVVVLWIIELITDLRWISRPVEWGILPRSVEGLVGILTAPFIHADTDHLLANTLPLLVVGTGLFYFYRELAFRVIALVWTFSGAWVWMIARGEYHIGASGLIYGFVTFLFLSGVLRRDTRLMAISLLVVFLYGSMVWGILPIDQRISWESHLLGSVAGIIAALYFRKDGPQKPKPQWQLDEEQGLTPEAEAEQVAAEQQPDRPTFRYDYRPSDETEERD